MRIGAKKISSIQKLWVTKSAFDDIDLVTRNGLYLTDYRERCLKDVITQLEPGLFKKSSLPEWKYFTEQWACLVQTKI